MNKKILIIGHGRHGKDTVAEILRDTMGYKFTSSSEFVGRRCVWPQMQKNLMDHEQGYESFEDCYADRHNHRPYWADAISEYNTPDKTRTASEMISEGFDMYVGMRRLDELEACIDKKIFDLIVWVCRSQHLPEEPSTSMELEPVHADWILDNNDDLSHLHREVLRLQYTIENNGILKWT